MVIEKTAYIANSAGWGAKETPNCKLGRVVRRRPPFDRPNYSPTNPRIRDRDESILSCAIITKIKMSMRDRDRLGIRMNSSYCSKTTRNEQKDSTRGPILGLENRKNTHSIGQLGLMWGWDQCLGFNSRRITNGWKELE